MKKHIYIFVILSIICTLKSEAQDTITRIQNTINFRGQISSLAHFNPDNPYPLYLGERYIPQGNLEIRLPDKKLFDFEASANIYGNAGIHFFDSTNLDGNINAYRLWGRYSAKQFEFRAGLQKINFGSATMLRALRWFDQVDPRDPLQLTKGVWGILGRYYFLNNANIWLWSLYGNKDPKGLEFIKTNKNYPEFGGRFQFPVPNGEAAITYNHRVSDSRNLNGIIPLHPEISENKIGIDARLDVSVGLWLEGVWVNKNKDVGEFTNQEMLTAGMDYTFGIGSGLNVLFEHMVFTNDENPFQFSGTMNFSALSLRYPIAMFDNINAILYYDWENNSIYNFVNWYRQFDRTTLYIMGYWNPKNNQIPLMGSATNLYGGTGIQIMFVYNY